MKNLTIYDLEDLEEINDYLLDEEYNKKEYKKMKKEEE